MNKKYFNGKIIFFVLLSLFICLDLLCILESYQSFQESFANDDIFGGSFIDHLINFILYAPLFVFELVFLKGINIFSKQKLSGASKKCILISMGIAAWIIMYYSLLIFTLTTNIYINIRIPLSGIGFIKLAWICAIFSPILYIVGKRKLKQINKRQESELPTKVEAD